MGITINELLFFYQFKSALYNSSKIDELRQLINQMTQLTTSESFKPEEFPLSGLTEEPGGSYSERFISDSDAIAVKRWLGTYYCYFSSTSSAEVGKSRKNNEKKASDDAEVNELLDVLPSDYINCGIMKITPGDSQDELCHVEFKFLSDPFKHTIERYYGHLTLSHTVKAVFCELVSETRGEKSYIIIDNQDQGPKSSHPCCYIALVLTCSNKFHKERPCCERIIISSKVIQNNTPEYKTLKSNLLMNDGYIRITRWGYDQVIRDIKQSGEPLLEDIARKFPTLDKLEGKTVSIEPCAFIPERVIRSLHSLSEAQQQQFEMLLRLHSTAPWYCKTKASKADILVNMLSVNDNNKKM